MNSQMGAAIPQLHLGKTKIPACQYGRIDRRQRLFRTGATSQQLGLNKGPIESRIVSNEYAVFERISQLVRYLRKGGRA